MTEKNDQKTDSMTEEEEDNLLESEEQESQLDPKHRTPALASLIAGYTLALGFGCLLAIAFTSDDQTADGDLVDESPEVIDEGELLSAVDVPQDEGSIISLDGGSSIAWPIGKEWVDPGYSASISEEDHTPFVETVSFVDVNTPGQYKVVYTIKDSETGDVLESVDRFVTVNAGGFIHNSNPVAYKDRLDGVVVEDDVITTVVGDADRDVLYVDNDDRHLRRAGLDIGHGRVEGGVGGGGNGGHGGRVGRGDRVRYDDDEVVSLDARLRDLDEDLVVIDNNDDDLVARLDRKDIGLDRGGNDRVDIGNFVPDDRRGNDDDELGKVGDFGKDGDGFGKGSMPGVGKGAEVYAYNFPSQGLGAGVGSPALGAAAGFAGLGAGIGQAVMEGQAVPALGGIGTYTPSAPAKPAGPDTDNDGVPDAMEPSFKTNPNSNDTDKDGVSDADEIKGMSNPLDPRSKPGTPAPGDDADSDGVPASLEALYGLNPGSSDSDGDGYTDGEELAAMTNPKSPESNPGEMGGPALAVAPGVAGGVAGLVSGAGAGSAAGLVSGRVSHPLGLGVGEPGVGVGVGDVDGIGGRGHRDGFNYDHLPKDGNLYIMMHVDGSGSILSTRKALEEMKDTILKERLLPYYKNDESLYQKRVLIVDGQGERTLKFFAQAAKKENVLALVFQDEAQPDYHLPNFNRKPEDNYMDDLKQLRSGLNGYGGLYRGIMFQVDRGKTFAKSFKEFVQNAWQGEGYLDGSGQNLKPYYWQDNGDNIRNRDGIVFSDEYHVDSEGDPSYYMNLIMEASLKVGLDLGRYGGGQEDGKHNAKISNGSSSSASSLNAMCPIKPNRKANPSITATNSRGETVAFCCKGCKSKFAAAD
jgi:hypothetical protein